MFAGSLVLALTLIGFAAWLQWNEVREHEVDQHLARRSLGQRSDDKLRVSELDRQYFLSRHRSRTRIHGLIGVCGLLILVATFSGHAVIWMAGWIGVMLLLLAVMILAVVDGFRTQRYLREKMPEVRREIFGDR